MKKVFSVALAALMVVSALIFPLISALAVNTVSWDAYPEWKNQYQVRGYVEIFSYTGIEPTVMIIGATNNGNRIDTQQTGIGISRSAYVSCNLQGDMPFETYYTLCIQG
jgi:hypothetical protein